MYSLTAGLCDVGNEHTHTDLPFPSLYKLIAMVRVVDKNTRIALLGMQRDFENNLKPAMETSSTKGGATPFLTSSSA